MTLLFYDFEVFKHDWMVVVINPIDKWEKVIINNRQELTELYNEHKNDIWVGFNSREYDQYIFKGIICGFDPYKISDYIINKRNRGWKFSKLFNQIELNNYDVYKGMGDHSLKTLEAFMGHNIKETSVSFDIDRKLTEKEIDLTIQYCRHDVQELISVFVERKEEFDTNVFLIKHFQLPLSAINKTRMQIIADILGGNRRGQTFNDEFDYKILPCVRIKKYTQVLDFYKKAKNDALIEMQAEEIETINLLNKARAENKPSKIKKYQERLQELNSNDEEAFRKYFYSRNLVTTIFGIPHTFAFGGIHGADDKPYVGTGIYLMIDVEAYYPSMAIKYEFGKRVCDKWENFELIHKENLRLKKIDKKARMPFKIADNGITGQLKDKGSSIYDPMANNCICINGQLMLLDLIERLEEANCCELIQSNTDGLLIKIPDMSYYEVIDDIVYEWEQRTGMRMEFSLYHKVFQGDVNNYCVVDFDGKVKTKGAYVKGLSNLDYDLPIVNKAITEYMINGTPVEKTINECTDLKMFQKIVKISSKYLYGLHNGHTLTDKTFRVFASRDITDTSIYKVKNSEKNPEKFANTPDSCFILNGNINDVEIPSKLDRWWYIDLTKQRLKEKFGIL